MEREGLPEAITGAELADLLSGHLFDYGAGYHSPLVLRCVVHPQCQVLVRLLYPGVLADLFLGGRLTGLAEADGEKEQHQRRLWGRYWGEGADGEA